MKLSTIGSRREQFKKISFAYVINEMKKLEKDGMSKDDHASAKKDLQKTVDDFVSDLSQMYDKKTKALSL